MDPVFDCETSFYSGWESYPMSPRGGNPYRLNALEYNERLSQDACRLFCPDDEQYVRILHGGGYTKTLENTGDLDKYLQEFKDLSSLERIILIPQIGSWGYLSVSEQLLRKLFTALNVCAEFLDLIHAFGSKIDGVDETFASQPVFLPDGEVASSSFRLCYLAKHVELNYKGEGGNPFSIRQMAVHHSFDEMSNVHTFVVINPSITFQKHLGEARKLSNHTTRWLDMHIAVAYAMSSGWRKYVSYLEKEFGKTQTKSMIDPNRHFSATKEGFRFDVAHNHGECGVSFRDIQLMQMFQDWSLAVEHSLQLNLGVFRALAERITELQQLLSHGGGCRFDHEASLSTYLSATNVEGQRAASLLKRIQGASALFRTILDFRALQAASQDNEVMLGLSDKARRDGRTLKTITLLTLIYLPATFVATLLSMGYIHVNPNHRLPVQVDNEMWVFGVLTLVLMVSTLLTRSFWERSQTRKDKRCKPGTDSIV